MTKDQVSEEVPEVFLLVENTRRGSNFGPFLRCASAFGIRTIVVVGSEKVSIEGAHGANKHVRLVSFPTVDGAISFLEKECQCTEIVGLLGAVPSAYSNDGYDVTVDTESQLLRTFGRVAGEAGTLRRSFPASSFQFQTGNLCLAFGKHAQGLSSTLANGCQRFIHVPHETVVSLDGVTDQQPTIGSPCPLLDAQSCLSIVLHHYSQWACYDEHSFAGHKFAVDNVSLPVDDHIQQRQRKIRHQQRLANETDAESAMDGGLECIFDFA